MYIDPNTGGMLFQILAVMFGVFSGLVLLFSSRIRMFFARLTRSSKENQESENQASQDSTSEEQHD